MVVVGVTMAFVQLFFLKAMKGASASFVAPFFYSTLIFATLLDFVVFSEWPGGISLVGAAVVVFGAILLAWREALAKGSNQN
jgi:drug/metabolite transporter (DMT)-like permease